MPRDPRAPRRQLTLEGLKARIKACTLKIGVAKRNADASTADALRGRRAQAAWKLAERHDVWTLINTDGHSEFVDRAEWEQRMVAWARRTGLIPRGVVPSSIRLADSPPPGGTTPPPPPAAEAGPSTTGE
jgi:hypothetical protein